MNNNFEDFTEENYRQFVRLAKSQYRFERFGTNLIEPHVIWRHDIDCSMHRSLRLAQIEAEEGVQSTFFVLLHSDFYNLFEKEVADSLRKIISLGHGIGLHFDPMFYDAAMESDLENWMRWERSILQKLFGLSIEWVSWHNPTLVDSVFLKQDFVADMLNVYGDSVQRTYKYCSDSNGYWRHDRLPEILDANRFHRLQVLTHDAWWTPEVLSPHDRVERCVRGRAASTLRKYRDILKVSQRVDVEHFEDLAKDVK